MIRTNDDSWDITESVGQTALQVAMGRMAETASENRLFEDPYAQFFIEAALEKGWQPPFTEEVIAELIAADPLAMDRLLAMGDYTAARTRYFDDAFTSASVEGIDQAVILAAGLDARAWRLAWSAEMTVYEIDQPKVLEFKSDTLRTRDVHAAVRYAPVGVDLRDDWPSALRDAGFDASRPTVWSAEGLLPYLSAASQSLLFERIDDLSAGGSRIALEAFEESFYGSEAGTSAANELSAIRGAAATVGDRIVTTADLLYLGPRDDAAEWFRGRGWSIDTVSALDLMHRYGRPVRGDLRDAVVKSVFVNGCRAETAVQ